MTQFEEQSASSPRTVGVAESCTGGLLMTRIVETAGSGDWFKGGVVAYASEVKFDLLDVPEGPVITAEAAVAMAAGVRRLMDTDVGIATTGVAGPESEEDMPVGTVFIGITDGETSQAWRHDFVGSPDQIRAAAVDAAYRQLLAMQDVGKRQ